jgi:hypothetical protein
MFPRLPAHEAAGFVERGHYKEMKNNNQCNDAESRENKRALLG